MNLLPASSIKGCSLKPKGWCFFFWTPQAPRKEDPGNMLNMYFFLRRKEIPPLPSSTRLIYRRGPRRFMKLPKCRSQEFRSVSFRFVVFFRNGQGRCIHPLKWLVLVVVFRKGNVGPLDFSNKNLSPRNLRMNANKMSLILTNKYLLCFEFPVSYNIFGIFLMVK